MLEPAVKSMIFRNCDVVRRGIVFQGLKKSAKKAIENGQGNVDMNIEW